MNDHTLTHADAIDWIPPSIRLGRPIISRQRWRKLLAHYAEGVDVEIFGPWDHRSPDVKLVVSADERTHLVDVVLAELRERGHEVTFIGPEPGEECDWPEVSAAAAEMVASGEADQGVVMCWTGTGATLAANKVPGARAALCHDTETARGARTWNDANILGLSLRSTSDAVAREILDVWLSTAPGDDDWNRRQLQRIRELEERYRPPRTEPRP